MALAALIDDVKTRNDWTGRRIVKQAREAGHNLSTSDLSNYRTKGMQDIVPRKVIALARGLQIPAYHVAIAALSDADINIPIDIRTPEDAIDADPHLSAATRRALLAILRAERAT